MFSFFVLLEEDYNVTARGHALVELNVVGVGIAQTGNASSP